MNKLSLILIPATIFSIFGCSNSEPTPAEQANFKAQLEQKKPDLSKIPESQKALVEGFMRHGKGASSAPKSSGQ